MAMDLARFREIALSGPLGKAKATAKRKGPKTPVELDIDVDPLAQEEDDLEYGMDDDIDDDTEDESSYEDDVPSDDPEITAERLQCARDLERAVEARDYRGIVEAVLAIVRE